MAFTEPLIKSYAVATAAFRDGMREARRNEWLIPFTSRATKQTARKGAPDSVSRSVVREGAQAAARNTVKRGARAAAPAPQASLTVSRQPSLRVAAKCGVRVVLAEAWSSVRATAKASAGPRNRNPASHGPAPLHSFAGATLRGPSSAS